MHKITISIGCFLIGVSAFLYATKHITAAIISMNINTPQVNYYEGAYKMIGFGMGFWIPLSLILGIIFILVGIFQGNGKWKTAKKEEAKG